MRFGYAIRNNQEVQQLDQLASLAKMSHFFSESDLTSRIPVRQVSQIISKSKSQLGQDVLALSIKGIEKPGFFVEFGATNGVELSNTYILEKEHGWTGILCEPAKNWHEKLKENRSSIIDTRCVFSSSGNQLEFSESSTGELSTIKSFVDSDANARVRVNLKNYKVTTVTLTDLLLEHNAPEYIDFISIDTEGSEYVILQEFNFEMYRFGLICVEHNYTANREKILNLLNSKGYTRIFEEYSKWDDWYVESKQNRMNSSSIPTLSEN